MKLREQVTPAQLSESLGINLGRTARLMRTKLDERLAPLGLTQAKWLILLYLSKNGGAMPQKDIAECIGAEGPTVVRVLDGLERMELILRQGEPADRRAKTVRLTPQAGTILARIMRITEEFRREMWAGVHAEDVAAHERVITMLSHNLGASWDMAGGASGRAGG